jgi:hypothetical protein
MGLWKILSSSRVDLKFFWQADGIQIGHLKLTGSGYDSGFVRLIFSVHSYSRA